MFNIKDHEIRELVDAVTDAARKYQGAGCMRDVMSRVIGTYLKEKRGDSDRLFRVNYDGLWMGGRALVLAKTAEHAVELVRKDVGTVRFEDVEVMELEMKDVVLYNYNGDY